MVASCDMADSPPMTAAAWIREFGLMLGWREGAKASRIRVGVAGVAGAMPGSEIASGHGDRLPVWQGGR